MTRGNDVSSTLAQARSHFEKALDQLIVASQELIDAAVAERASNDLEALKRYVDSNGGDR